MTDAEDLVLVLQGGQRLPLPASGSIVIGSEKKRTGLTLDGQGVDAVHCAIGRLREGGWAVKDLGSEFGTLLNGRSVQSERLQAGDELVLGSQRLRIELSDLSRGPERQSSEEAVGDRDKAKPEVPAFEISGFKLDRLLGRGGMGSVFLAMQESLDRPVALKVLSRERSADKVFVERFQSEARAAAVLHHPNVVIVHDVGADGGLHYLSMEFMAGGSLEARITEHGPIPWRLAVNMLADACRGLVYAEEHGIVHRDIKPDNLMMDASGTVKIADLGLATTLESQGTPDGQRVYGTPHFVSPEQARGEAVDHRSDLYSLGATAYRLLSGRTLFEGDTVREILLAQVREEPEPLDNVPTALGDLILKCLAKDPAERPQSASDLLAALQEFKAGLDRGQDPTEEQGSKLAPGLVLGLVLLIAALTWIFVGGGESDDAESSAPGQDSIGVAAGSVPESSDEQGDGFLSEPAVETAEVDQVEQDLRILELEGTIALRDVPPGISAEEELALLRAIRERYAQTAVAAQATERIDALEEGLRSELVDKQERTQGMDRFRASLRAVAELTPEGDELPDAAGLVRQVMRLEAPQGFEGGEAVEGERHALLAEVLPAATARLDAAYAGADPLARAGHYDELERLIAELLPRVDVSAFPILADELPAVGQLRALQQRISARAQGLPDERAAFQLSLAREDRLRFSAAFGPSSAFLDELLSWNRGALAARFARLAAELRDVEMRTRMAELQTAFEAGERCLANLAQEFDGAGWRRRAVSDPRASRPLMRNVLAVLEAGLILDVDGRREQVDWSATRLRPDWWNQLFVSRLARDYSVAEADDIIRFLRLVAVTHAAELARAELLRMSTGSRLQPDSLTEGFQIVQDWERETGRGPEALEHEAEATRVLERVARAMLAASWAEAETSLEELLEAHGDTLLVTLLSIGPGDDLPADAATEPPASEPTREQAEGDVKAQDDADGDESG